MVRIGIVGAGSRGKLYARSLHWVSGVEVVGLCDVSTDAREQVQRELPFDVYPSHQDLLGEQLDAVVIATPDFAHYQPTIDAADAGLHMMIEKPLADNAADAHAMRDAVKAAGVECMVAFENRWSPPFIQAREMLLSGAVGDVLSQTAQLSNSYHVPTQMLPWSSQTSPGWFLMPHTVDLAIWLSGKQPQKVYATGFKRELVAQGIDTWDAIHALLTFADGTTASFESLWVMPDSMPSIAGLQHHLVGSKSAIFVNQQDQMLWVAGEEKFGYPRTLLSEIDGQLQGPAAWMVASFARKLLQGEPVSPTIDEGVLVTEVVQAIHDVLDDGIPHSLSEA